MHILAVFGAGRSKLNVAKLITQCHLTYASVWSLERKGGRWLELLVGGRSGRLAFASFPDQYGMLAVHDSIGYRRRWQ